MRQFGVTGPEMKGSDGILDSYPPHRLPSTFSEVIHAEYFGDEARRWGMNAFLFPLVFFSISNATFRFYSLNITVTDQLSKL